MQTKPRPKPTIALTFTIKFLHASFKSRSALGILMHMPNRDVHSFRLSHTVASPWILALALLTGACGSNGKNEEILRELGPRPENQSCFAPDSLPQGQLELVRQFPDLDDFNQPIFAVQAPGDGDNFYVVERSGRVRRFPLREDVSQDEVDLVLDISSDSDDPDVETAVDDSGEGGFHSVAFHPDFASNGYLYLSYTTSEGAGGFRSRLTRVQQSNGSFPASSETLILEVEQPAKNHNGGSVLFGPDGFLYWSLGDGGGANDDFNQGQRTDTPLAAILRLDVDNPSGGRPYGIPSDNPFAGEDDEAEEIFAWGFRNPWRMSFDRADGELWVGDVGQGSFEEVDVVTLGGNYGWSIKEASCCFNKDAGVCFDTNDCDDDDLVEPVHQYGRDEGRSITGGYVYRGESLPEYEGQYFFGDFETSRIWTLPKDGGEATLVANTDLGIGSFAEDASGEIYVLDLFGGGIYRLERNEDDDANDPNAGLPATLGDTGCFDDLAALTPASGVIAYDLQAPLWSDGAGKSRWLALPDDASITLDEDGDYIFPPGSVLIKHFERDGRRLEIRFMVQTQGGIWAGYTYAWNEDGTEANLVDQDGMNVAAIPEQEDSAWEIPSRNNCMSCHTRAAGRSLGLEVAQQDADLDFGGGQIFNQVDVADAWELLDTDGDTLEDLRDRAHVPFPRYEDEEASFEDRARAYLHMNCSGCHRPDGPGRGDLDLRAYASVSDMGICDTEPSVGDLGIDDARVVAPGDPGRSVLLQRMLDDGEDRMPPLATVRIDDQGVDLVRRWIESLDTCP